ncbi:MAG: biotin--[acetyl-CoA-carboxylase] ligase, partial [Clostridiales bacterium]
MRAAILELLKSQEQISGELISSKLHISRAAVAKHIKILRQAGYQIEASPKTGYRLIGSADILSEAELTPLLNPRDLWKIHCFAELPSTNTHLRKLAEQNAADHTIIIAEQQTAGQGRLNRSWYSENRKSLLTSLLLRPPIPPTAARTITLTTAIAICTALRKLGIDAWIKWPNDILSGSGKKLCGIKSEMRCDMDNTEWLIVGIGLNINNQDFPDELPHA